MALSWLWKKNVDDEVAEELEFHLEMRTRELIARGRPWERRPGTSSVSSCARPPSL